MGVRIVTDSTADIPVELAEKLGIAIVPLTVFLAMRRFWMALSWITRASTANYRPAKSCRAPRSPRRPIFRKRTPV